LGSLSEIQDSARFPRGHDCLSSCRLGKCAKESSGKRPGRSGNKLGAPQLKWVFSEAAVLFLRQNQPGQNSFATLARTHSQGKALTVLTHS
jgi:transposase